MATQHTTNNHSKPLGHFFTMMERSRIASIGQTRHKTETYSAAPPTSQPAAAAFALLAVCRTCPFCSIAGTLDWALAPGDEFDLTVLPDPSMIVVVSTAEPAHALGIVKGAYSATLRDTGFVYGLKFKPGGFHPFCKDVRVASFAGGRIPLAEILPGARHAVLDELVRKRNGLGIHRELEMTLAPLAPRSIAADNRVPLAVCARIVEDAGIRTVTRAADSVGMSVRALQRIFRDYVGVGPKWVIRRCRLQEAAARLEAGAFTAGEWADFALGLGYCDQSHLIREFKQMTGYAPAPFVKTI
jgi:AraC-like DNA-binding protein